jgi:capsular exopolysaccharide synthesis family protein
VGIEDRLIILKNPDSPVAESYRSLRAALARSLAADKRIFSIVSSWGGEGKSMVSANLAVSLSQLLMDVVLIDGDLRRPTLSRVFEVEHLPGVMELLESGGDVNKFVCSTPIERLYILPAGKSAVNPADLLGAGGFKKIISGLRQDDLAVVIDTSPVSACSDALLMSASTDGAIMVVAPDKWQGEAEAHFAQDLEDQGVELLGAVMNNADAKELLPGSGYGQYGMYGQYGKGYGQGYGMYGQYGKEHEVEKKSKKFSFSSLFGRKKKNE